MHHQVIGVVSREDQPNSQTLPVPTASAVLVTPTTVHPHQTTPEATLSRHQHPQLRTTAQTDPLPGGAAGLQAELLGSGGLGSAGQSVGESDGSAAGQEESGGVHAGALQQ